MFTVTPTWSQERGNYLHFIALKYTDHDTFISTQEIRSSQEFIDLPPTSRSAEGEVKGLSSSYHKAVRSPDTQRCPTALLSSVPWEQEHPWFGHRKESLTRLGPTGVSRNCGMITQCLPLALRKDPCHPLGAAMPREVVTELFWCAGP